MPVRIISTNTYKFGQVDMIEARSIPRGAASSALNWLTKGDRIELRYGQRFLGTASLNVGLGRATGLKKATRADGVETLFGTYAQKLKYFDITTEEWVETGSNILGSGVVDSNGIGKEMITMSEYVGLAGNQLWLNSPNITGYYKIMVANPGSYADQYNSSKNFKGQIRIDTNRTFLWGRNKDKTGVYGSYIDTQTYTTVSAEALASVASGTLAFKGGGSKRTCFAVVITVTASGVTYTDDYSGNLEASDGSASGTINYTSGAYTTPASGAGTVDYQWEDSTNNGIADFTKSGTRTAGQGFVFRQDEGGGPVQKISVYNTVYYCHHLQKTWALNLTSDDTAATNLPYRQNVGIPGFLAACESGNGIYYVDSQKQNDVRLRLLTYSTGGAQQVIPVAISNNINLNDYLFDQSAAIEYGDYILFACATSDSTMTVDGVEIAANNRVIAYNKIWRSIDLLDYNASCFEIYNNALLAGDSVSNNFIELFSGFDDFDSPITNYWIGKEDDLDIDGLKKNKQFYIEGNIAPDQSLAVYLSFDHGPFVLYGTISGDGDYVDTSSPITIGSRMLGTHVIGGGSNGVSVYHYERLITVNTDRFETVEIKYEALGLGYVSVSAQKHWDVRFLGRRVPQQYRR